jgi:putative ABC transport system permease protein
MMLWVRLALRNVTRNVRRSLLTAATVLLATALMTLAMAWVTGMFGGLAADYTASSGHFRLVTTEFAARESLQPLYQNIADAAPVLEALRRVPGIVDAEPRITTGVTLTAGDEIGDHFALVVGATDAYYRRYLNGQQKLSSGRWLSGGAREVVLGRKLTAELKAKVGDDVVLMGQTQDGSLSSVKANVVGVVGGDAMLDQEAFLPLEEVRYLTDMQGGALEILAWTRSAEPREIAPIVARVKELPELEGLTIQPWYERQPWASMLPLATGMKAFIQALIVFIAALAIFNTMTMSVLERTTEIGVLRAMGLTRRGAVGLFVLEGLVIGLVGGVLGTLLGALPAWYLEVHGVTFSESVVEKVGNMPFHATMYADLTPGIAARSVVLGLVIAAAGALLPALRAASIRPVIAMRPRR